MPYATRQGTIDFPKRKVINTQNKLKLSPTVKESPESKVLTKTSASSKARKAFHGPATGGIVGRKDELKQLKDFLTLHLKNQTSGSMYVSGLPGTGKTASVNYVLEQNGLSKKFVLIKINCTGLNSSKNVFNIICEKLKLKSNGKTEKDSITAIENYLLRKHKIILLILDEIDQLESKSQAVLYRIFEWASQRNSKLVLIGIANAVDLIDGLPRLHHKLDLKPVLLHFAPYSKDEITEILKNCLTEAGADKIFAPGAIELISAKIAGTSGDIRRALDLGKRVIEIVDLKNRNESINVDSLNNEIECSSLSPSKRKRVGSPIKTIHSKLESLVNEIVDSKISAEKHKIDSYKKLSVKESSNNTIADSSKICLSEVSPKKLFSTSRSPLKEKIIKSERLRNHDDEDKNVKEKILKKLSNTKETTENINNSSVKNASTVMKENIRKSPRKLEFDVDSKDVLSVVKTAFGSSKNFKPDEESSFPLHQKLLICTLLLLIKKGKKKDLNVGRLYQVYTKICSKRGLTSVDKSGFLFLCRQVEMTGVLQIGKGLGTLAKVTLLWDESEISNSLKDLNMLSSILTDTSCLL